MHICFISYVYCFSNTLYIYKSFSPVTFLLFTPQQVNQIQIIVKFIDTFAFIIWKTLSQNFEEVGNR